MNAPSRFLVVVMGFSVGLVVTRVFDRR